METRGSSLWEKEAEGDRGQQGPKGLQCPPAAVPDPDLVVYAIECIFHQTGEAGGARMHPSTESLY